MTMDPITIQPGAGVGGDGQAAVPSPDAVADSLGGPTPERVADALDGTLAGRLRAKHAEIQQGTRRFDVPGWDGELVLEARVVRDRKQLAAGMTNEQLIIEATARLFYVDADGAEADIPGGWPGVGAIMGIEGDKVTTGQIVRAVFDNPLRLDGFAEQLIAWMMGRRSAIEQVLGE